MGLKTWKALALPPGLFREEKGRAIEGEVSGEAMGVNPEPPTSIPISGEFPSPLVCGGWPHPMNAGCGDITAGGGVGGTLPPPTFISKGGVILTGDMMALGRGSLLVFFMVDTIWTGPFPISLLPGPMSIGSSSEPLERSLPESLLLDEPDELVVEEDTFLWPRPLPVSGMRAGGIPVEETVTLPTFKTCRDEEEVVVKVGGWVLVRAGTGLLLTGLLAMLPEVTVVVVD